MWCRGDVQHESLYFISLRRRRGQYLGTIKILILRGGVDHRSSECTPLQFHVETWHRQALCGRFPMPSHELTKWLESDYQCYVKDTRQLQQCGQRITAIIGIFVS